MHKGGRSWVKVDGRKRQKVDSPQTESGRSQKAIVHFSSKGRPLSEGPSIFRQETVHFNAGPFTFGTVHHSPFEPSTFLLTQKYFNIFFETFCLKMYLQDEIYISENFHLNKTFDFLTSDCAGQLTQKFKRHFLHFCLKFASLFQGMTSNDMKTMVKR